MSLPISDNAARLLSAVTQRVLEQIGGTAYVNCEQKCNKSVTFENVLDALNGYFWDKKMPPLNKDIVQKDDNIFDGEMDSLRIAKSRLVKTENGEKPASASASASAVSASSGSEETLSSNSINNNNNANSKE
jgi:hypothetical protein